MTKNETAKCHAQYKLIFTNKLFKKKKVLAKAQKKNMEGQHQTVNNSICDYASLSHPQYVSL